MSEPLAHSAHDGAPDQKYRDHVGKVVSLAMRFGREATAYCPKWGNGFLDVLEMAANYHDLGKLELRFSGCAGTQSFRRIVAFCTGMGQRGLICYSCARRRDRSGLFSPQRATFNSARESQASQRSRSPFARN